MEGTLEKWQGYFSGWKEVKFKLEDGFLYEDEEEAIKIGESIINVKYEKEVEFEVDHQGNVLYLRAKSKQQKNQWIDALVECEGNYYEVDEEDKENEGEIREKDLKKNNKVKKNMEDLNEKKDSDEDCDVGDENEDKIDTRKLFDPYNLNTQFHHNYKSKILNIIYFIK